MPPKKNSRELTEDDPRLHRPADHIKQNYDDEQARIDNERKYPKGVGTPKTEYERIEAGLD